MEKKRGVALLFRACVSDPPTVLHLSFVPIFHDNLQANSPIVLDGFTVLLHDVLPRRVPSLDFQVCWPRLRPALLQGTAHHVVALLSVTRNATLVVDSAMLFSEGELQPN